MNKETKLTLPEIKGQYPGLVNSIPKIKVNNKMRCEILDWARDHNLVIHPGGGYEYYLKNYVKSGRCPCDPERSHCPCPESVEETREDGHCKCHLFWRDLETFKEAKVNLIGK